MAKNIEKIEIWVKFTTIKFQYTHKMTKITEKWPKIQKKLKVKFYNFNEGEVSE